MAISIGAAVVLALACVLIHYEALRLTSRLLSTLDIQVRLRVAVVVLACLTAHVLDVVLFAAAFMGLAAFGAGELAGEVTGEFGDYLYFSLTSYSTLGFGDISPRGALRLLSGTEALLGLFLIAWSTSFTYLAMERLWPLHSRIDRPE